MLDPDNGIIHVVSPPITIWRDLGERKKLKEECEPGLILPPEIEIPEWCRQNFPGESNMGSDLNIKHNSVSPGG